MAHKLYSDGQRIRIANKHKQKYNTLGAFFLSYETSSSTATAQGSLITKR